MQRYTDFRAAKKSCLNRSYLAGDHQFINSACVSGIFEIVQLDLPRDLRLGPGSRLVVRVEEVFDIVPSDVEAIACPRSHLDRSKVELRPHEAADELLLHPPLDALDVAVAQWKPDAHPLIDCCLVGCLARVALLASEIDVQFCYHLLEPFAGGFPPPYLLRGGRGRLRLSAIA